MSPDATMTSWYLGNWASPWGSRIRQFISTLLLWPDIYLEYTTPWRKRKPLTQVQKDTPSSPEIQIYDTERSCKSNICICQTCPGMRPERGMWNCWQERSDFEAYPCSWALSHCLPSLQLEVRLLQIQYTPHKLIICSKSFLQTPTQLL